MTYIVFTFLGEMNLYKLSTSVLPKPVQEDPRPAPFVCLPYLTHLIPLISSFVETARAELGVSD